ncbi:Mov34/MPN/PAD-1 family protein [Demequina sp. NBRC 110054]|uniref:Mov34/MPN/PAD-1 family protein n=1 Tax=Demequina sp. NBRC 110054 TaxID=1570343 RepID=UPI000A07B99E
MTTDRGEAAIRIDGEALADAEDLARTAAPNESGGILVGWWEPPNVAIVRALLPVQDHDVGRFHYSRRHSIAQAKLEEYRRTQTDANSGYIGEWHSHPAPLPPSSTDRRELNAIVKQTRERTALVVVALDRGGVAQAHGLVGRPRWPRQAAIDHARIERTEP